MIRRLFSEAVLGVLCIWLLLCGVAHAQIDLSALTSVDDSVAVNTTYQSFNRRNGEMRYSATLTNSSENPVSLPIFLAIGEITSPSVTVANADDTGLDGTPVIVVGATPDALSPGQSLAATIVFRNPTRARFSFTPHTFISGNVELSVQVVDEVGIGLGGLAISFQRDGITTQTDLDGFFDAKVSSGEQLLTIHQGVIELLNQPVIVRDDGSLEEFGNTIVVTLPEDPEPLKDNIIAELPPLSIEPPTPSSLQQVTISLFVADALQLNLDLAGDGCGELSHQIIDGNRLIQSGSVGHAGQCLLTATVATNSETYTLTSAFTVVPIESTLPAVTVVGGDYHPTGILPGGGQGNSAPRIINITAPGSLINGGTATFRIEVQDPDGLSNILRVHVAINGVPGFFSVPAVFEDGILTFKVHIDQDFFDTFGLINQQTLQLTRLRAQELSDFLIFNIQVVDRNGNNSTQVSQGAGVQEVGTGTLQFSLSWDTLTDVDLHVVEPSSEEIYWQHTTSTTGGVLDLDSNPACRIDGVNNENVTWTPNDPPEGEYIVRVDYWDNCEGQPANYTVTVNNCGESSTFTGSFGPGDADQGSAGSGREITRLDFVSCSGSRAAGRVTYEDFAQTSTGLSTSSTKLPAKHAMVEVRRESDDEVLEIDSLDADGRFDIEFRNDGDAGYYVLVIAKQDNNFVKQKVVDENGGTYAVRTQMFDETVEPEKLDFEIEIDRGNGAPAFNIFDMGVLGASLVRTRHGATPPMLTWLWTDGKKGSCNGNVSCYSNSQKKISVLSIAADRDEYDDLVLLHEYGHFYQYQYSNTHSPGGSHSSNSQVDPRLAWGEGSATFFGNLTKNTSLYLDTIASGIGVRLDIETLSGTVPLGAKDDDIEGRVSEAVVAAILWDLSDSSNESPNGADKAKDTVSNADGVFTAMAYLKRIGALSGLLSFRNHRGVDLVDFLDGWFCEGNDSRGTAIDGVEGIVNGMHDFPYDYAQDVCTNL